MRTSQFELGLALLCGLSGAIPKNPTLYLSRGAVNGSRQGGGMKRKLVLVGTLVAIIGVATAPLAAAQESLVQFETQGGGSRTHTAVAPAFAPTNVLVTP